MSEIKALDELRYYAGQCCPEYESYDSQMIRIADEIQAEVDKRFIELPVDADGVPIRPGDLIEFGGKGERLSVTHVGWTGRKDPTIAYRRPNGTIDCSCIGTDCHHVRPDSIGRVAMDMRDSISEHVGLAPDEVLAFVERLKRLERAE